MAELDFPSNPTDGQTWTDGNAIEWTYTADAGWSRAAIMTGVNDPNVFSEPNGATNSFAVGDDPTLLSGANNTLFGLDIGASLQAGFNNTLIGAKAGKALTQADNNVIVGAEAGIDLINDNASHNVIIGNKAMPAPYQHAASCVVIGASARPQGTGQTNSVVVGHSAVGKGNNTVVIGNDNITDTHLKGALHLEDLTAEYYLKVSADGETIVAVANSATVTESFNIEVTPDQPVVAAPVGVITKTFRCPYGFELSEVKINTAQNVTGVDLVMDIEVGGSSIFVNKPTIDSGERTTIGAAVPPTLIGGTFTLYENSELVLKFIAGTNVYGASFTLVGTQT